jgi:hypothetical protein
MRLLQRLLVLLAPIALAGCISYTSSQPSHTTVTAPPGSTVICGNGQAPPC